MNWQKQAGLVWLKSTSKVIITSDKGQKQILIVSFKALRTMTV